MQSRFKKFLVTVKIGISSKKWSDWCMQRPYWLRSNTHLKFKKTVALNQNIG